MILKRSEFMAQAELDEQTLEVWLSEEWIMPSDDAFTDADLARARLIHELAHDMGINREGIGVVLHLIDQVHGLRRVVAKLSQ